ncbi:MAG: transposase family protein [Candidatus Accumulibacter sp.]|uniref:Transposase family protein n=1 Tax=Candidatus Accumulibacter proximus TaxID=2954385 RepID=A0A935Q3J9_9PROT|nr:transposase family protein [Candidatus Accumulibacter proximus]
MPVPPVERGPPPPPRSWRHLDFFEYEAHLHAEVPRVACTGQVTQTLCPGRARSHFTLLFGVDAGGTDHVGTGGAAFAVPDCGASSTWAAGGRRQSHAEVRAVGVDETASKRGQTSDLDAPRLPRPVEIRPRWGSSPAISPSGGQPARLPI